MSALPKSSPYVIVGAGIHGLSTAYHLAKELSERGLGPDRTSSSWRSRSRAPELRESRAASSATTTSSRR
jgi:glycine/D-amino acid oxidase-like deaminating enzyme